MEMVIVMAVICGLTGMAIIGSGLVVLSHWLKTKRTAMAVQMVQDKVVPALEDSMNRMLETGMKKAMDMSVNMVKEMTTENYYE